MGRVKNKSTKPELKIRKLIYSLGYRYRLHDTDLPGKPDIVFKSKKMVIFVHGCFWHRHNNCKRTRTPKSNIKFWENKFSNNVIRDNKVQYKLRELGWDYLIIWECEINDTSKVKAKIISFLDKGMSHE